MDNVTYNKVDIGFALDVTGSMDGTIYGVQNSVQAFADAMKTSGFDVNIAGDAFGDEIRDTFQPTADIDSFKTWVAGLSAWGGGDSPENDLDAVMTLANMTWRPDAQHVIIVITNSDSHQAGDGSYDCSTTNTFDGVTSALAGRFVVHAISPGWGVYRSGAKPPVANPGAPATRATRDYMPTVDIAQLARNTGGTWMPIPDDGNVDLTTLPIGTTLQSGYVITFDGTATDADHQDRLIVTVDGSPLVDWTYAVHY